tara:strand:+ start:1597 stop:2073 length:477 start_codon:yes stop_codon:yes gene_type:complete
MTNKDNKRYWDQLKVTDPKFTKKVNKGFGDITTIDPMYQIGKMTEVFGPVGDDWGYDVNYILHDQLIFAEVTVWTGSKSNNYGPVCSVQKLFRKTGALDDEAPKKAMTDALTKALSHLGVSADVFLGMHDNSKYIEKVTNEIAVANKAKIQELKANVK